ncbi:hypothetical protein SAY86_024228 [Trapa natans]|uniref:RING-type E3 ubiquitin transferase n=1 Tax=Trapa natans TaxID=22666 RepID=A0AAN7MTV4_TRANT|nr:hypothetical protein SAY86_024228 [Trapa natans]
MDSVSSTLYATEKPVGFGDSSSVPAADGDVFEDSCSICLEPFTAEDPSTVTNCKHEYHLQCILEWSQRSKECPICWRILTLEDPNCQELVDAVEWERSARSGVSMMAPSGIDAPLELDFDESAMQRIAAVLSRNHDIRPREGGSIGPRPSDSRAFRSWVDFPGSRHAYEANEEDRSRIHIQSSTGDSVNSEMPIPLMQSYPPSPVPPAFAQSSQAMQGPFSFENSSFSESLRSKFSSASARYKESISKSTRSLKEKILASNSVKELRMGVQREMSAGFSRLIDRLDLSLKQTGTSESVPGSDDASEKSPVNGRATQEGPANYDSSYPDPEVCDLGTIPGRLEVIPSKGGR